MDNTYINQAGNIVLHDGEKYLTVKREQLKEVYDAENYSIEGVVVVPNDKTHDGTTRMISLVGMDCDNPEHGCANEDNGIYWGECDFKIPEFKPNLLKDFDGKGNTEKILKYYTAEDWKTVDKISDKCDEGYYPAAACCKRYKTKHTDDWYLPAIGELTYLYDNFEAISKAFDTIIDAIGTDNARQIPASWFWSSSESTGAYARGVYLGSNGGVYANTKNLSYHVRAFASINYLVDNNLIMKIVAPEGYEVDKEKSTFEKIVFKPIEKYSKTWEEFCKRNAIVDKNECYIGNESGVRDSSKFAEPMLALMQLLTIREKEYTKGWVPDWTNEEVKYINAIVGNELVVDICVFVSHPLSFPTKEMAEEFLRNWKDLLEIAKPLL